MGAVYRDIPGAAPLSALWRASSPGLLVAGVFSVFINLLKLATPIYILQLLDRVVASRSIETLLMLTVIVVLAITVATSLEVIRRRMFVQWGGWLERTLGSRVFKLGFDSGSRGVHRALRDVGTLRGFVSGSGFIAWLDVIWVPFFIALVFLIAPPLGWIALIAAVATLVLGTVNELLVRGAREASQAARGEDRAWIAAAERGRESLSSRAALLNLSERWAERSSARIEEDGKARATNASYAAAMRMVGRLLRVATMGVGIWLVIIDGATLGAVVAANVLSRIGYSQVRASMIRWRDLKTAMRAYARTRDLLCQGEVQPVSRMRATVSTLVLEGMSHRHRGVSKSLFRGVDLRVESGEVLCVVGLSAAGKSSLCRLLSGVDAPRSGHIRLNDVDVGRLQRDPSSAEIGYLPQNYTLFQATVRENIANVGIGDMDEVARVTGLLGIHDLILSLPQGYDTLLEEQDLQLSAGQRKAIALARSFYGKPRLVVLDEPFPNLDRRARNLLEKAVKAICATGAIVVITAQSRSVTRLANKVLLLDGKRHVVLETAEDLASIRQRRSSTRKARLKSVPGTGRESPDE